MTKRLANLKQYAVLTSALLLTGVTALAAKAPAPLMSVPQPVRDLYYGDALFYFYQDDYFQSLVHLDAALSLGRVPNHQTEAELIKGALYLSLGQHTEAGRIFQALLNDNVDLDVRNRAWFYLGKLWYERGYLGESEKALRSIQGTLAQASLETERQVLFAQVLLNQGRYDEAINALQAMDSKNTKVSESWLAYVRFNLGVALVRQQRIDAAAALLDRVGQLQSESNELLALRDKANVALGFTWLKLGKTTEAEQVLQRVRLNGPQSNKALLGLGWAQSSAGKYQEALAPWLELKQRDLLDAAVQEAYLAIPYAYAQLNAEGQAAEYYQFALDSFKQESERLDESIAAINQGSLLKSVLENDSADQSGWYWQLRNLPDAPETRYLYDLLASNTFQEALKNYRDLQVMQRNLETWTQSMSAFQDMVDNRRLAFTQRTAAMEQALNAVDMERLEKQTLESETRLNAVAQEEDVVALATSTEQANWRKVAAMQATLANADSNDPAVAEMQDKLRLLRGTLYWDMSANYKSRLWREQKEVRELAVATKEARRRYTLVDRAREQVPQRNDEFAARVAALTPRLQAMVARCQSVGAAQTQYLAQLATQQLEQQKQRLAQYALQAQFALASIYDRAADARPGTATPAAQEARP
ncbi:MAG: tetratricopeptide repeat protein [Steroidobacteraceae bacterium]